MPRRWLCWPESADREARLEPRVGGPYQRLRGLKRSLRCNSIGLVGTTLRFLGGIFLALIDCSQLTPKLVLLNSRRSFHAARCAPALPPRTLLIAGTWNEPKRFSRSSKQKLFETQPIDHHQFCPACDELNFKGLAVGSDTLRAVSATPMSVFHVAEEINE